MHDEEQQTHDPPDDHLETFPQTPEAFKEYLYTLHEKSDILLQRNHTLLQSQAHCIDHLRERASRIADFIALTKPKQ